jgi:hypothetical protein
MADNVPKFPSLDDLFTQVVRSIPVLAWLVYLHERSAIPIATAACATRIANPERALVWMHSERLPMLNNASRKCKG